MKKMMKKAVAVTTVVALMVMVAGCGAKDEASKKVKVLDIPLTQEEYAFGIDKNQPELLEQVNTFIGEIKENGTFDEITNKYFGDGTPEAVASAQPDSSKDQLVVATNAAFEPFEYMNGDSYYGVDMEIAAALAEYLGKELVISNMDFDAVCLSVGQGKADIAMAGLTIKEERKEFVNFTDAYYDAAQKLIVLESDETFKDATTVEDVESLLHGLSSDTKIGVQQGTTGQYYVEGDESWGFSGYDVETVAYKSGALAVQDLVNGNVSYVIIDEAPAQHIAEAINQFN